MLTKRQATLDRAYAASPERFVCGPPIVAKPSDEVWINEPKVLAVTEAGRVAEEPPSISGEARNAPTPARYRTRRPVQRRPKAEHNDPLTRQSIRRASSRRRLPCSRSLHGNSLRGDAARRMVQLLRSVARQKRCYTGCNPALPGREP